MFNYLAFLYGGCPEASDDASADGRDLAQQCLEQLSAIDNPEQFPPGLLILLASPSYLEVERAERLLAGVHQAFADAGHPDVPLIGSSVAAVFFDRRVYERGALLVCLASRMLEAKVAVGLNARKQTEQAADALLDQLELSFSEKGRNPNPLVNRLLLTFLPGFGAPGMGKWYLAPELHQYLQHKFRARVSIIGGSSSANSRERPGLQFANCSVYVDALVGARLTTGFPFTSSIGHGLLPNAGLLHVAELADDHRTILRFEEGVPAEVLGLGKGKDYALLGHLSLEDDPVVNIARASPESGAVWMLKELDKEMVLKVLEPKARAMREDAAKLLDISLRRLRVERPVGCLGLHCAARCEIIGLDIGEITDDAEKMMNNVAPYVGGFFDGEIGLSPTGRSLFDNWCLATLCFGDEMRERTPFYSGFDAMYEYAKNLKKISSLDQAIDCSVDLIFKTGFPGAMISLVLENEGSKWIVAKGARGSRFEGIMAQAKRPFNENGLFARIAYGQEPPLICDSRIYFDQDLAVLKGSKVISQYIVPLKDIEGNTIAFLQIDLGDARYKDCLQDSEKRVLDSLVALVESTIARLLNREEANIARGLDDAVKKSLPAESISEALQRYLVFAVGIFGADMGHIRLERDADHALVMIAGTGPYYEAFRQLRPTLTIDDDSPTRQAFRSGKTLVINDAPESEWLQKQCNQYQRNTEVMTALKQVGSFANVVFRDESGKTIGTINLVSRKPWFFTRAHVRSLEAMGQRVGFLLGHLRRHINLQLLQNVGTDFVRTANFEEPLETLTEATERYCRATNADVACLYLWDNEVKQFILRAEHGWAEPGWVDAARYRETDHWTGQVALASGPQYVPNLYSFKRARGIEQRYARQMFGAGLSEEFVVEAIGLPLKLKDRELGVLTLYRHLCPEYTGKVDSFTTTDLHVLQRAADNLATMVSAQLYYLRVRWEREEAKRHAEVCSALEQRDRDQSLEKIMCLQMLQSFRANQVSFYLANATSDVTVLTWVAGFSRCQTGEEALPPVASDDLIQQALEKELVEKFHEIPASGWDDPEVLKKNGWIERVCLRLRDGERVIGVLDVHWSTKRRQLRPILAPHNPKELIKLGQEIGAAYQRQKKLAQQKEDKMQADRNGLAAQTMGVMVFQSAHRLLNLVQDLHAMPDLIADAESEQERRQRIEELSQLINSAVDKIKDPMNIASRTRQIVPQFCNLHGLLAQVLSDLGTTPTVEVRWKIPESMVVWADENLAKEAVRNIIRNAMQAMTGGGVLDLRAELIPDVRNVRIIFADTGSGMSKDEVKAALSGFVSTRGGTGLGVLVSLLLIRANNGDLKIKSRKGEGTQIIVTLPVEPAKEAL